VELFVDAIFLSRAVGSAAIEGAVRVALEVFCETIEPVNGVAHRSSVISSRAAIAGITISPLGSRCNRQAERE
jgi:hypothetical protein